MSSLVARLDFSFRVGCPYPQASQVHGRVYPLHPSDLFSIVSKSPFPPERSSTRVSEISAEALKRHVAFLASDELEGRESLRPGSIATEYIASRFQVVGLESAGDPAPAWF